MLSIDGTHYLQKNTTPFFLIQKCVQGHYYAIPNNVSLKWIFNDRFIPPIVLVIVLLDGNYFLHAYAATLLHVFCSENKSGWQKIKTSTTRQKCIPKSLREHRKKETLTNKTNHNSFDSIIDDACSISNSACTKLNANDKWLLKNASKSTANSNYDSSKTSKTCCSASFKCYQPNYSFLTTNLKQIIIFDDALACHKSFH